MSVSNEWLTPLQRSYQQIKEKLISNLKLKIPEITDFSEGNIFIILINIFAAIAEVLHYYIDNMGQETFFTTARRYSSLLKHAKLVDYHVKAATAARVDVNITKADGTPIASDLQIPVNTKFTAADGTPFLSTKTVIWEKDTYGINVPLAQKELKDNINFGIVTSPDMMITLGDLGSGNYYQEGSMNLYAVNSANDRIEWELVSTFAYSGPSDNHFMVEMDVTMQPYIKFGDGVNGAKPSIGFILKGSYYVTKGDKGNIEANSITSAPSEVSPAGQVVVTNPYPAVAGSNFETFEMIKEHLPMSIRTLGVAITKEDYEEITKMTPGVDKAYVNYICGKLVDIYITPDGGGIAPQALIDSAYQTVLKKKVITTNINVLPTGVSEVYIKMDITGKKSFRATDIANQVVDALLQDFSYNNSDIGRPVRVSDIYALIDNLSLVDFLSIKNLFIKPWAQRIGNTVQYLNIGYFDITSVIQNISLILTYTKSSNRFLIVDQDTGVTIIRATLGEITPINYNGNTFSMRLDNPASGSYNDGDQWSFTIIPNNSDQELPDFTIPIISSKSNITMNINETV